MINLTQCHSIELMELNDLLNHNLNILINNTNNDTIILTLLFNIMEVSGNVSNLTNMSTALVPNDINTTNNIASSLIRYFCAYIFNVLMCMYIHDQIKVCQCTYVSLKLQQHAYNL